MSLPEFSVIIASYDRHESLRRLLKGIAGARLRIVSCMARMPPSPTRWGSHKAKSKCTASYRRSPSIQSIRTGVTPIDRSLLRGHDHGDDELGRLRLFSGWLRILFRCCRRSPLRGSVHAGRSRRFFRRRPRRCHAPTQSLISPFCYRFRQWVTLRQSVKIVDSSLVSMPGTL